MEVKHPENLKYQLQLKKIASHTHAATTDRDNPCTERSHQFTNWWQLWIILGNHSVDRSNEKKRIDMSNTLTNK